MPELDWLNTTGIVLLVALGAFVQTLTGFAMALIIMGGATLLDFGRIADTAIVVSLVSMTHTSVVLRRVYRRVDLRALRQLATGMVPGLVVGVWLLGELSATGADDAYVMGLSYYDLLRKALGAVIILAGVSLMSRPEPYAERSGTGSGVSAGLLGGLSGGLFGASGAPVAFFMYRQPLELTVITATLLAVFSTSHFARTVFCAAAGQVTAANLTTTLLALPLMLTATWCAGRVEPHIPKRALRYLAFLVLILMGAFLLVR